MKTLRLISIMLLLTFVLLPASAMAKTLAGERLGYVLLGLRDYDDFNETGPSIEIGATIPITDRLDITPFFRHEEVDSTFFYAPNEFESNTIAARGDFRIKEIKDKFTAYAGAGAGFVRTKVTTTVLIPTFFWFRPITTTATTEEDDLLLQVHGGVIMDLAENVGLKPECAYLRAGDYDDINCGVLFNFWLNEFIAIMAQGKFFFNDRDLSYAAGVGLNF